MASNVPQVGTITTDEISLSEIKVALKAMKSGKACGGDQIAAEMLKVDTDGMATHLYGIFNTIWITEKIPSRWTESIIVKVPKKGDLSICDNWRGICLMPIPAKIFGRIIVNRLKTEVEGILREEQAGFRSGASTTQQIFTLRNIIEQSIEFNAPLYMNFIDFQKAFDSVNREMLWKILEAYKIPDKYINIIKELYLNNKCFIEVDGELTEPFLIKSGVKQGCVMSGLLFIIVIDWIMRNTIKDKKRGIRWKFTSSLEDLDFADDIVLMSSKFDDLQQKTYIFEKFSKTVGLTINRKKTKSMRINEKYTNKINLSNKDIEDVSSFTYLGVTVNKEGGTNEEIRTRIAKAQNCFCRLNNVWRSSKLVSSTKLNLFNALVKSVLLYGCETWKLTKAQNNKLDAWQNKCLRKILQIYWPYTISNVQLYSQTRQMPLQNTIRNRRWKWVGHVLRMPPNGIPAVALTWAPEG